VTAGIDAANRHHVVAACDAGLRYSVSKPDGSWSTTAFPQPSNRKQVDPQIGFNGNIVYVAYSWLAAGDGGCGDDGFDDVGVYYRQRTLPDGSWSEPVRIGLKIDHLQAFRVEGTTLHAAVQNEADGRTYYETLDGSTTQRYRLAAGDWTSLRIGADGRARIAYESSGSIRIATFTGSGFSTVKVPGSDGGSAPVLVLDSRDRAHVVWLRNPRAPAACGDTDAPDPKAGMYYATNASGKWQAQRFTSHRGSASLQVDGSTGIHLVVASDFGLRYYAKSSTGSWQHRTLESRFVLSPVIRLDPATGSLLVAYIRQAGNKSTWGVYTLTRS
jgi:hypothetical protein